MSKENVLNNITIEKEQQFCLVLGKLFLVKGGMKEATKHCHKAINRRSGSAALNQKSQDRILDARSMLQRG